jgi:hypothetical protein
MNNQEYITVGNTETHYVEYTKPFSHLGTLNGREIEVCITINFHLLQEEDYMQHQRCFINTRLLFGSYSRRRRLYK